MRESSADPSREGPDADEPPSLVRRAADVSLALTVGAGALFAACTALALVFLFPWISLGASLGPQQIHFDKLAILVVLGALPVIASVLFARWVKRSRPRAPNAAAPSRGRRLEPTSTADCPYCKTSLAPSAASERAVRCSSCDTRHHAECWSENGGCTTFACSRAGSGRSQAVADAPAPERDLDRTRDRTPA